MPGRAKPNLQLVEEPVAEPERSARGRREERAQQRLPISLEVPNARNTLSERRPETASKTRHENSGVQFNIRASWRRAAREWHMNHSRSRGRKMQETAKIKMGVVR